MASRLTRQRAMRRAWRGRSSRADLRAWSLRLRRAALTRPSGGGGGTTTGRGAGHQGIVGEDMDARRILRVSYPAAGSAPGKICAYRRAGRRDGKAPLPFPILCPLGMGREGASFTTRPRAATTMRRRTADSAGLQHPQHGAVEGVRNPRHRHRAIKPQQGEQGCNDALERFAVAFDGPPSQVLPVHVVPILHKEQNRNI